MFFLSGVSSLIYQMVWLKKLHLIFGVTTPSIVAILVAFMAGLSLGSFLIGKYSKNFKNPFLFYGILEAIIGIYALFMDYFFSILDKVFIIFYNSLSGTPLFFDFLRFILSLFVLLAPTFLMGGTLPLLVQGTEKLDKNFGKKTGFLYGINTLGAFFGTFLSTFYTIPTLGFKTTNYLAIFLNFLILFSILFLKNTEKREEKEEENLKINLKKYLLAIVFFMGFTSFGYEILWNRILILHTGSNVYAYGLVLCNILLGIGLGSLFYSLFSKIIKNPLRSLGFLELILGIFGFFQIYLFLNLTDILTLFAKLPWDKASHQIFGSLFLGSFLCLIFPSFLMGFSFPLSVKIFFSEKNSPGNISGKVYSINTLGCITGTVATGLIFIPLIGTARSFFLMIILNLALSLILLNRKIERTLILLSIFSAILMTFTFPKEKLFTSAGVYREEVEKILTFKEDITGSIVAIQKPNGLSLEINGINVAGTSPDLYIIQKLQGHIPLLLAHHHERVLHIGLGSGGTLNTVSKYPVEEIIVAEISPGIVEVSSRYFRAVNEDVFKDKRIKIEITDGRNYVLASLKKFDVILSDSIHPKYLGNGFLYTKDYFNLIYNKMEKDGVASMWLPLYSLTLKNYKEILKAFSDVFPCTALWWFPEPMNSFTIVVGSKKPFDFSKFLSNMQDSIIKEDLSKIGLEKKEKMLSCLILDEKNLENFLKSIKPHTDNLPTVEYESNKIFTKTKTWLLILKELRKEADNFKIETENLDLDKEKYLNFRKNLLYEMERQIEILEKAEPF
ncbi:MAG: fused MFS/spermidine synthase [Thermoanaerobaculia bacterium]